ncbi:T9SS type A sorting domain-containing protein [Telluribacter sp. SYSU D00476]|uniref:T9SS type A sorting domain-containing protein n=1 Tax=Telluribacter sp. SYSU D00476 TaxID=2811430 RepID=UPI001FF11F38|nr:T9SS type A sorting domain-containing protein [Telluribacter sp. SYSU D00476]
MKKLLPLALLLCLATTAHATHFLGGTIQTRHVSGLTYEVKVLLYFDRINGAPAADAQVEVELCMGDGKKMALPRNGAASVAVSERVAKGVYTGTYTYSTTGLYTLAVALNNRSNALNIRNGQDVAAYLYTRINTSFPNTSPELPAPTFEAGVSQLYSNNLRATDPDGDRLVYRLVRAQVPSSGQCSEPSAVANYLFPNEVARRGTFILQEQVLSWNAPTQLGTYIYTFVVEEWRNDTKIAESLHEHSVFVVDKAGTPVTIPPYQAVEFGDVITALPAQEFLPKTLSVNVYPVPSQDWVTVEVRSAQPSPVLIQLLDLQGRILQEVDFQETALRREHRFQVGLLSKGSYLIRVNGKQDTITRKLVR